MRRPEADTKEMGNSYLTLQPVCLEAAREKGMGQRWGSHPRVPGKGREFRCLSVRFSSMGCNKNSGSVTLVVFY